MAAEWPQKPTPNVGDEFDRVADGSEPEPAPVQPKPQEPEHLVPGMHLTPGGALEQEVNTATSAAVNERYQKWIEQTYAAERDQAQQQAQEQSQEKTRDPGSDG